MNILVVDDERAFGAVLVKTLEAAGHAARHASSGAQGLALARETPPDAVLLDLHMPDITGLELLPDLRRLCPGAAVILVTAKASTKSAVAAMKAGAEDYLEKPFAMEELHAVLDKVAEKAALRSQVDQLRRRRIDELAHDQLLLEDPAMRKVYRDLEQVGARDQVTVLIQGETGTGKQHAARLLHLFSPRAAGPFVELNCAALPDALLESELFGHEAGAFTDARQRKLGLFETAQKGTLFLDEVGELPPAIQTKLLKVLEQKTLRRLGGLEDVRLDVRLVSATNRELGDEVAAGRFRGDLYYRLNVFGLRLPPLRERPQDLEALARHFFGRACQDFGRRLQPLDAEALAVLGRHRWPGNVRELKNLVERLVLQAEGERVEAAAVAEALPPERAAARERSEPLTKAAIQAALAGSGGDKSRAALALGVSRPTLYRHLRAHGLD